MKCKENVISITDVLRDQQISLRQASASNSSIGGQGYCDEIAKQSAPQKMLTFYVIQNVTLQWQYVE